MRPSGPINNLVCDVSSLVCYSKFHYSFNLSNISFFTPILLTLNHVHTVKCLPINFSVNCPNIFFIYFDLPNPFYRGAGCDGLLQGVIPFTTLFGWSGIGGGTFDLIVRSPNFLCLLNAVSGGCLKTSAKYWF